MTRNTLSFSLSFTLSAVFEERPRTLTRARTRACLVLATCCACAAPLQAQRVAGRVIDDATGERVPLAQVSLVTASGTTVRSVISDSAGFFVLEGKAGGHRIQAWRIGYATYTSEAIQLRRNETVSAIVRLAAQGVKLPPLEIVARGRDERGRDGFDRRRALGKGWFLTLDSIRARNPIVPNNLFDGIPGVVVFDGGTTPVIYSTFAAAKCFVVYRDHMPVGNSARGKPDPRTNQLLTKEQLRLGMTKEENPVDRIPLEDIRGIEIYRNRTELPRELHNSAKLFDLFRVGSRHEGTCGMIWIWTRSGW